MLIRIIWAIVLLLASYISYAQVPPVQWQKCYGGAAAEGATCIIQTADGGFAFTGTTLSNNDQVTTNHGQEDYWVVKLDDTGAIVWQKTYGGSDKDLPTTIQQTKDGGYIVAGTTWSNNGDVTFNHGIKDYWIVKLNDTGAIQWQKSYGGTDYDEAFSIQQTFDSGYIVIGQTSSNNGDVTNHIGAQDYWVLKLDKTGVIQWQKCYGGTDADIPNNLAQTSDSGYIITGWSQCRNGNVTGNHMNTEDYWVVKLNDTGKIQWEHCFGGNAQDEGKCAKQTKDGGYIVCGYAFSNNGDVTGNNGFHDSWIIKLSPSGAIQWQKCYGGYGQEHAEYIEQTLDGGYIIAGQASSNTLPGFHRATDAWIFKIDSIGTLQWQKPMGGTYYEVFTSTTQTNDGGYIVAGFAGSTDGDIPANHGGGDVWVVKFSGCPFTLSTQPSNQNLLSGSPAQFVVASATANSTFQWQTDNGTGFKDIINGSQYSGANTDSLRINSVTNCE